MTAIHKFNAKRRRVLALLGSLPALPACALTQSSEVRTLRHKFRGIRGAAVVLDAFGEPQGFLITTDTGSLVAEPGVLSRKNRRHLDFYDDPLPVPRFVRFVWREGDVRYSNHDRSTGTFTRLQWMGGTIAGDYTIPVAERIPDEVLDEIRANGGGLRLKLRVHDKGVYLGWDIERRPGYKPGAMYDPARPGYIRHFPAEHFLAGGDFREARIFKGKPVRMGWYIDADGRRVETDF